MLDSLFLLWVVVVRFGVRLVELDDDIGALLSQPVLRGCRRPQRPDHLATCGQVEDKLKCFHS